MAEEDLADYEDDLYEEQVQAGDNKDVKK